MRPILHILFSTALALSFLASAQEPGVEATAAKETASALRKVGPPTVRIAQLVQGRNFNTTYPNAVPTILQELHDISSVNVDPEPVVITSFEDEAIFETPFIYVNFDQREDWNLTPKEASNLRKFLERGGFMMVDAGITADFLRKANGGQNHSFAEWRARPELVEVMKPLFPGKSFKPLPRKHPLFSMFYKGLPDASLLDDNVREFVINEKWPEGTYSMVGLEVNGRIAVLATPIIAMGWGKTQLGTWETTIGFRIRESAADLDQRLKTAAYEGERFEVTREDSALDTIYCADPGKPSWVMEPGGRYRVFRYHHSQVISDYAHTFYTQLGINILLYSLTH